MKTGTTQDACQTLAKNNAILTWSMHTCRSSQCLNGTWIIASYTHVNRSKTRILSQVVCNRPSLQHAGADVELHRPQLRTRPDLVNDCELRMTQSDVNVSLIQPFRRIWICVLVGKLGYKNMANAERSTFRQCHPRY